MIDYAELMAKAERLRKQFGEDNHSPIDIFSIVQGIEGLTLVYYPMGDTISGMCVKGQDGRCTIAINSSMTLGRQRFSLAHELYHLYYDDTMTSICSKKVGTGSEIEKMADVFAAYFLMPRVAFSEKVDSLLKKHNGGLTILDVIRIEQYFQVSHQTALYQLKNCNYINQDDLNVLLNAGIRHLAETIGYSSDLYDPLPENKKYCTFGHYIEQANQLFNKEIISRGKYEELLLAAFRDDLVYNTEEGGNLID